MPNVITEYPQFFTATNLEWKKLLKPDKYKDIVIDSLRFLVKEKRIILYGFVINQTTYTLYGKCRQALNLQMDKEIS